MQLSRRQVLAMVPAGALLAIAAPMRAYADTPADHARLLANAVAIFAGTAESNARPEAAAKLAAIQTTARTRLAELDAAGPGELFAGVPLGTSDPNLNTSFLRLYEIALATCTPGVASELVGSTEVRRRVIDGLVWLHENYYGDQAAGYYGNWFTWEIGISASVSKTLVLLDDDVAAYRPELVGTYVASMDAYLRNGVGGDVNLDSRFHTGANLADITTNRVLQGALTADDARVSKAIADQSTVFATIDPYDLQHGNTDGYYADGSFIQHHSVAYTGSYGRTLLTRVVQTVKLLDGTAAAPGTELADVVHGWVRDGFAPVIVEGWMAEIVKGRAVSRTGTGYADVATVVEAVVDLADYASAENALALRGYVRYLEAASPTPADPTRFVSPVSIVRYADILADDALPTQDLNPAERTVAFNAMDRTVHRRTGYTFALARSSDRISRYEYMNGENLMPWFQGDGMHYLYLAGQDQTQAFGVDFFTTVSPYRLPGTTVPVEERQTIPELYGRFWYENPDHPLGFTSSSESQNTYVYFPRGTNAFSGGATLGTYGVAGMVLSDDVPYVDAQAGVLPDDFVVYANARATKSWFLLDDEIVVLAADVHDPHRRDVVTTLDSRIAAPGDGVVVTGARRGGRAWSPDDGPERLEWLRWENPAQGVVVGYALLDAGPVAVTLEDVTRSRRVIRVSNPDTAATKRVFTASVAHPRRGRSELAYAIVPGGSAEQLAAYQRGPVQVLRNDGRIQAVRHSGLGLVAANVFAGGTQQVRNVAIDGPASVLVRETDDGGTSVALSDPTMDRRSVTVTIRGRRLEAESADDGVEVRRVPGGTEVRADVREAYGASFTATLRPR
ncbi:polysaccharide lyase 8 alpha-helical [Beutenbergia cavernae DSM 12333]|uniref:Polysaccharide lyase 8 alpha-helical n=1 Tax=Beutenbergia cavernae (strain ATCC BAA-8 / DSM 12333 / CCUG 43141 / JCM 11478 / NBRC 16432 / NCIMB 13614 / HKI 0122) TaxID=471853 RepID=C5BVJ9_BEUC1|nr:polysaccharide lyase family 8 super-sandwich domain-containing protein [Beutenbergia cavernae]ACQ78439.1 polysaccharide lyase 8 alpha-helical [Beutenbergia cavernae DSM 12333]